MPLQGTEGRGSHLLFEPQPLTTTRHGVPIAACHLWRRAMRACIYDEQVPPSQRMTSIDLRTGLHGGEGTDELIACRVPKHVGRQRGETRLGHLLFIQLPQLRSQGVRVLVVVLP